MTEAWVHKHEQDLTAVDVRRMRELATEHLQCARRVYEALGEDYEPRNRDEWYRTFEEGLAQVKARSDAWRTLLTRIEQVDPEWLDAWRRAL